MHILGVRIDNFSKKEILEKVESFLNEPFFHQIATVNPEFILQAQKNDEFKNILNSCDLNVADGVGIQYAFLRNFSFLKVRFAGVDLLEHILKLANEKKLSLFLAINEDGLSSYLEVKNVIEKKYPNIALSGNDISLHEYEKYKIQDTRYDILLCNFGAPTQEKFINSVKNDTIRLAMGVGGSFDFMTGKVKRAPKIMRFLGLEWLWRLLFHPSTDNKFIIKRIERIFRSVVVFPIRVILNR